MSLFCTLLTSNCALFLVSCGKHTLMSFRLKDCVLLILSCVVTFLPNCTKKMPVQFKYNYRVAHGVKISLFPGVLMFFIIWSSVKWSSVIG